MVDFKNEQLYREDSIDKQLKITFDSGIITNTEIPSEQFELTESLTSESQLVFGSCEASEIKFRIYNVFLPLKDKWLTVTQTLNGDTSSTLQIGKYKVYSDKPTADRGYRDVVAYDAMYDIINTDVASWYNSLTFPMSLKAFRDSFFEFFGIEQIEVSLVNDSMQIERTIDVQVLSGRDVIQSICEINGCFGHIGRDGRFKYVFLKSIYGGLYPSNDIYPANDLYPQQPNVHALGKGLYVDTPTYEDFTVKPIDKLQIREKEGDIGVIVGNGDNTYIVEDNFLVYGKSTEDLEIIADNMLSVIEGLEYRPFDATLVGNPCLEVGDNVRLHTKYQIIDSYVLQRTLSGVQCLRDEFLADGEEYQSEKVNDIQTDIKQLKGKSNTLERTLEETKSTIANVESGLQSTITQTAEGIRSEVSKKYSTKEETKDVASTAESNAKNDTTEKLKSYSTTTEMNSAIDQKADSITSTVSKQITETKQYADKAASTAESNAKNDTTEKLKSYSTTTEMNSAIDQKADSITLTVSKQITETKQYADNAASTAESNAKNDTTEKLKSYSTTTEMNSAIDQKADSITQTVASSQSKWSTVASDGTVIPISEYGYGLDGNITGSRYIFSDTLNAGDIYLDQKTGYGWKCTSISSIDEKRIALFGYRPAHTFSLITDELSSRIEQTISSISLEINNGDKTAGIVITLKNEDGTTSEVTGTIEMTGMVTFNDLEENGTTVINGSNITTGTIDAEKVNVINVVAESVDAENITGTVFCLDDKEIIRSDESATEYGYEKNICLFGREDLQNSMYGFLDCIVNGYSYSTILAKPYDPGEGYTKSTVSFLSLIDSHKETSVPYLEISTHEGYAYGADVWESDSKLKKNIGKTEESAIDKIRQIEFIQFDWKSNDVHVDLGVSANQIENIIPKAIINVKQPDNAVYDTIKNISNSVMTTYSLKAIQEQQEIIENQQIEINTLKKQVSFLMQKLGDDVNG